MSEELDAIRRKITQNRTHTKVTIVKEYVISGEDLLNIIKEFFGIKEGEIIITFPDMYERYEPVDKYDNIDITIKQEKESVGEDKRQRSSS